MKTNRLVSAFYFMIFMALSISAHSQATNANGNLIPGASVGLSAGQSAARAAQDTTSTLNGVAAGVAGVAGDDDEEVVTTNGPDRCPSNPGAKYNQLKLMGIQIPGTPTGCIRVANGVLRGTTWQRCGGPRVVNPGNPIYSSLGRGTSNTNPEHYFYCVSGISSGWMRNFCLTTVRDRYAGKYNIRWDPSRDEDHACGYAPLGSTTYTYNWNIPTGEAEPAAVADTNTGDEIIVNGRTCSSVGGFARYRPDPYPPELEDDVYCSCKAPHAANYFRIGDVQAQCANLVAADVANRETAERANAAPAPAPEVSAPAEVQFRSCLQSWTTLSRTCKQSATDASANCQSKQQRNAPIDGVAGVVTGLNQTVTARNAGQGVQGTCFQAGVAAMGAREALVAVRETCNTDYQVCNRDCTAGGVDRFLSDCPAKLGKTAAQLESESGPLAEAFNTTSSEVRSNFEEGTRVCQNEVQQSRSALDRVSSDLARTTQASAVCACQTSSSNGQNCSTIPNIEVCEQTGSAHCASVYGSIGSCVVGSPTYDAKACGCAQNPSAPGCKNSVAATVVSNFGGNLSAASVAPGGSAVSGFAGGSSGSNSGGGSFSDLGITGDDQATAILANNLKTGSSPVATGGGATGASVGGGGAAGGGAAATEPELPPGEKPSKLKDMFNDLKNTVSRAFFGNSSVKKPVASATAGSVDVSRFKPNSKLRGGPIERDIASANEKTIFELVNDCANGLRCKSTTANEMLTGP